MSELIAIKQAAEEIGAKAAEVIKNNAEKSPENFDPDKRIDTKKTKKDTENPKSFDPDKRIGIKELISKAFEMYKKELLSLSEFPETLNNLKDLKPEDLKIVAPDKVKELKNEFKHNKAKLIKEWEERTGKEWPRYTEDVVKNGVVIRRKGDLYDAHHIKPHKLGGENTSNNITPLSVEKHQALHAKDSALSRVIDLKKNTEEK